MAFRCVGGAERLCRLLEPHRSPPRGGRSDAGECDRPDARLSHRGAPGVDLFAGAVRLAADDAAELPADLRGAGRDRAPRARWPRRLGHPVLSGARDHRRAGGCGTAPRRPRDRILGGSGDGGTPRGLPGVGRQAGIPAAPAVLRGQAVPPLGPAQPRGDPFGTGADVARDLRDLRRRRAAGGLPGGAGAVLPRNRVQKCLRCAGGRSRVRHLPAAERRARARRAQRRGRRPSRPPVPRNRRGLLPRPPLLPLFAA